MQLSMRKISAFKVTALKIAYIIYLIISKIGNRKRENKAQVHRLCAPLSRIIGN